MSLALIAASAAGTAGVAGLLAPLPLRAQGAIWPSKSVTVVVPFAPGGAGNGSVRILADIIGPQLGQPMVVDNRAGGGGIPGTASVAQSSDDHLLLMGSTTMTILPSLRNDLPYEVQRDLQPIGMISTQPLALVVAASSAIKTLDDLIKAGRSGEPSMGNSGVGTLSHLTTELLNRKLGTKFLAVPYKGDSALLPDVASGTVAAGVFNLPVAMPLIQAGRLRAVAVSSPQPVPALPQATLLKTLGDEFVISGWAALFAARHVPAAGVERLEKLLRSALADPKLRERFEALGVAPESGTAAQLREFVRRETARWGEVVRAAGIKLE